LVLSAHPCPFFVRRAGLAPRSGLPWGARWFSLRAGLGVCGVQWNSLLRSKSAGIIAAAQSLWHSLFLALAAGALLRRQATALVLRGKRVVGCALALARHGCSRVSSALPWGVASASAKGVLVHRIAILSTLGAQPGTQPDLAHKAAQVRLVLR
jgi:hypothetical protein